MKTITTEKHHTTCSALISIVMPTYNRAQYITRCIESILTQSYTNWELWVIDDGSTDETSQIVQDYISKDERIHLYAQENQGPSTSRKIGIRLSKGACITFVDSDDYIEPHYLEHLLEPLKIFPNLECIKGGYCRHEKGRTTIIRALEISNYLPSEAIAQPFHARPIWSMLWSTSFLKSHLDAVPDNINLAEDVIMTLLMYPHLKNVCFSPHADYHYIVHGNNISYNPYPVAQLIKATSVLITASKLTYWNNSETTFSLQFSMIAKTLKEIVRTRGTTNQKIALLKQLPAPMLAYRFFKRRVGFGSFLYTWLLKHRLYKTLLFIANYRLC